MTRALWLFANMLLVVVAIGAGWFAMNAPQVARPILAPLGDVELTLEAPPAPPGPLLVTTNEVIGVLHQRPLFTRPESPDAAPPPPELTLVNAAVADTESPELDALAQDGGAAPFRDVREESPIARTMLDSLPAPLSNAPQIAEERRAPLDDLAASISTPEAPEVTQFFAWRSMNYAARDSDEAPPASAAPAPSASAPAALEASALETPPQPDAADEAPLEALQETEVAETDSNPVGADDAGTEAAAAEVDKINAAEAVAGATPATEPAEEDIAEVAATAVTAKSAEESAIAETAPAASSDAAEEVEVSAANPAHRR